MIVTDLVLQTTSASIGIFSNNRHHINAAKENYNESEEQQVKGVCLLTSPQLFRTRSEGELAEGTCISYTLRRISSTRHLRNVINLAVSYRVGGPVVKMRYERLELPTPVSALKTSLEQPELNDTDELNTIIIELGDEDVDIASGLRVPSNRPKRSSFNLKDCIF